MVGAQEQLGKKRGWGWRIMQAPMPRFPTLRRVAGKARRGPGKVLRGRRWNELSVHVLGPQLQP